MGKVSKNSVKLNNAGMTLVEILIAIAILSVAIIPLMYAFVNSMRYNAKGRELQQTTALAHTIIENCKADSYDEVKASLESGFFVPDGYTLYSTGDTYYLKGVTLENQQYDVELSFSAHDFGGNYSYDILRSITMNPYMDGMLTVNTNMVPADETSITPAEMDAEAYIKALEDIALGIKDASLSNTTLQAEGVVVDLSTSYLLESFEEGGTYEGLFGMTKKTIIDIFKDASGNDTVTVTYKYSYKVSGGDYKYVYEGDALGISDVTLEYEADVADYATYTYTIYSNSETKDANAKLENVYIMYYPSYSQASGEVLYPFVTDLEGVAEEFTINNNLAGAVDNPRIVNVYLVKQKNTNYTDEALITFESAYASAVKVTGNTAENAKTNLYHNIDYNLADNSWISGWDAPTWSGLDIMPSMIVRESKTLMYDFDVNIYKSGAIVLNGGNPEISENSQLILNMDGTDLDW